MARLAAAYWREKSTDLHSHLNHWHVTRHHWKLRNNISYNKRLSAPPVSQLQHNLGARLDWSRRLNYFAWDCFVHVSVWMHAWRGARSKSFAVAYSFYMKTMMCAVALTTHVPLCTDCMFLVLSGLINSRAYRSSLWTSGTKKQNIRFMYQSCLP
jgi:hypothetical protein